MPLHPAAVAGFMALVVVASAVMTSGTQAQNIRANVRTDIEIAPDRSVTQTIHQEATPLVESAVREAAQARWAVPGNQTFEVIEAFTRKSDGRIIPADPNEFATQDGVIGEAVSFLDVKVHQITFRDMSVGDTSVVTLRIIEREHFIPGQYSGAMSFDLNSARRALEVTLRAPADLAIRHDERRFAYREPKNGDTIVRHWSGTADRSTTEEKGIADLTSVLPGFQFSTFASFEAIATAYYEGVRPKLTVTPEIDHLAAEITAGKHEPQEQAQAIFEWVSRNIRPVAVLFGTGRYVPNDTHTILSRRFGDCKDHAVLLGALLAAKGIASEQVLIGVNSVYQFPKTPMLQSFNHVIVFIPALDRYLDPTTPYGTFDHLPTQDLGKPVVRVSDQGAKVARTPTIGIDENTITLDTRLVLTRAVPAQRGETKVEARGEFADFLRVFLAQAEAKGKEVELANLARLQGLLGTFTLDAPPWTERREPVRLTAKWESQQAFVQTGWRAPLPLSPLIPHPSLFFGVLEPNKRIYPAVCRAGRIVHTLDVAFPDGVTPWPLPLPLEQRTPQFWLREQWSAQGNHLRVKTEITSFVSGMACAPDQIDAVRTAYAAIAQKTNPALTFASRPINAPAAAAGLAAQQAIAAAPAAQPNNNIASVPGQWSVGKSADAKFNNNPNCRPGGDTLRCLQGELRVGPITPPRTSVAVAQPKNSTAPAPGPWGIVPSTPSTIAAEAKKVRTTEIKPEPKQSGGKASNSGQTVPRAVPVGLKIPIDFFGSVNPDCSPAGLPTARILVQPLNGKITVESGMGYSNFPPNNQRYECNKQKSEGIHVFYEPRPGFGGPDSASLDILTTSGQEIKRQYSIAVGGDPSKLTEIEAARVVPMNQKLRVDFIYAINPDCSLIGQPLVRVVDQPRNGNVVVENDTGFSSFTADNQRYECNKRKSEGVAVVYQPHHGFAGTDSITVDIIMPRGLELKRHYAIEVK